VRSEVADDEVLPEQHLNFCSKQRSELSVSEFCKASQRKIMCKTVYLVYNQFGAEQILSTHHRKGRTVVLRVVVVDFVLWRAGGLEAKCLGWTEAAAVETMAKTMAVASKNFMPRVTIC
jgi:hypothetical protein